MDAGGVPVLLSALLRQPAQGMSFYLSAPIRDKPYGAAALEVLGSSRCLDISHRAFRFSDVVRLFRFLQRQEIHLVLCEGKSGGAVGRLAATIARKPCVYIYQGVHYKDYGPAQRQAYFAVERVLTLFTNAVVAVSTEEHSLIRNLKLCPASKLRLCENGVAGPADVEAMPSSKSGLQFVHITRFNSQKNSELLLHICERLRARGILDRFLFLVIGEGEPGSRDEFERKIAEKSLRKAIVCRGYVANTQSVLASSHGLLSTSRWEGQPLGVLECMAAARCVVATDVVGHQSIIRDGHNGLLFKDGDAEGAAKQLAQFLETPKLLASMADAGRQLWKAKYSLEQCARRRADLYRSVMTRSN
jgi:glycosyltransferase involved in cell wall biosynthesis